MNELFTLSGGLQHNPEVDEWLSGSPAELYAIARQWFKEIRLCGKDVKELIHDGCPTACVGDAAFAYVNVFKAHVNVGFFLGALLDDPDQLLLGSGKRMRHVKLMPDMEVDTDALRRLVHQSYTIVKAKL